MAATARRRPGGGRGTRRQERALRSPEGLAGCRPARTRGSSAIPARRRPVRTQPCGRTSMLSMEMTSRVARCGGWAVEGPCVGAAADPHLTGSSLRHAHQPGAAELPRFFGRRIAEVEGVDVLVREREASDQNFGDRIASLGWSAGNAMFVDPLRITNSASSEKTLCKQVRTVFVLGSEVASQHSYGRSGGLIASLRRRGEARVLPARRHARGELEALAVELHLSGTQGLGLARSLRGADLDRLRQGAKRHEARRGRRLRRLGAIGPHRKHEHFARAQAGDAGHGTQRPVGADHRELDVEELPGLAANAETAFRRRGHDIRGRGSLPRLGTYETRVGVRERLGVRRGEEQAEQSGDESERPIKSQERSHHLLFEAACRSFAFAEGCWKPWDSYRTMAACWAIAGFEPQDGKAESRRVLFQGAQYRLGEALSSAARGNEHSSDLGGPRIDRAQGAAGDRRAVDETDQIDTAIGRRQVARARPRSPRAAPDTARGPRSRLAAAARGQRLPAGRPAR